MFFKINLNWAGPAEGMEVLSDHSSGARAPGLPGQDSDTAGRETRRPLPNFQGYRINGQQDNRNSNSDGQITTVVPDQRIATTSPPPTAPPSLPMVDDSTGPIQASAEPTGHRSRRSRILDLFSRPSHTQARIFEEATPGSGDIPLSILPLHATPAARRAVPLSAVPTLHEGEGQAPSIESHRDVEQGLHPSSQVDPSLGAGPRRRSVQHNALPEYSRVDSVGPPQYANREKTQKTIAELLYRHGFYCPILWLAAIVIITSDLDLDTTPCDDLQVLQARREHHRKIRETELYYAKKSLKAFAIFMVAIGIIIAIILMATMIKR